MGIKKICSSTHIIIPNPCSYILCANAYVPAALLYGLKELTSYTDPVFEQIAVDHASICDQQTAAINGAYQVYHDQAPNPVAKGMLCYKAFHQQ